MEHQALLQAERNRLEAWSKELKEREDRLKAAEFEERMREQKAELEREEEKFRKVKEVRDAAKRQTAAAATGEGKAKVKDGAAVK